MAVEPENRPKLTYSTKAKVVRPGVSEGVRPDGVAIEFDTSAGTNPDNMGPADLLVNALAACILKNVERFSKPPVNFKYEDASISVIAEREENPPKISKIVYELKLKTEEKENRIKLLHKNISKFGTIYNTLSAACDVSGEITTAPEEDESL